MSAEHLKKLKLTPEQKKAFNRMKKAHSDCKKLGVHFEMLHETVIALNGEHIESVSEGIREQFADNEIELQDSMNATNSFYLTGTWVDVDVCIKVKD
ncbi:hypothetical protein [Vibrio navarrensis]|uniref:hypothetical protein n=1 Tax=Vibrio navarrensis TaxID=29495 RepID=UPI001869BB86|nr:hypothetical protein [Vibrio navarrensis]MBE4621115.1 hypothetical protein [Vibrio navarrensis]